MQKMMSGTTKHFVLLLLASFLLLSFSADCFAQKKKKDKKTKAPPVEVVEDTIVTEKDALLSEDAAKWGTDSLETVKNYSLYREFFKQKLYKDAMPYWEYIITNAPSARKTPLVDGEKMYKHYLDEQITGTVCVDKEIKKVSKKACKEFGGFKAWKITDRAVFDALLDSLFQLYDLRVEHFGEEGYITTKKSRDLVEYTPENEEEIFNLRKKAMEIDAEETEYDVLYYYFKKVKEDYNNKVLTKEQIVEEYDMLSEIVAYNIENNEDYVEKYETVQNYMDNWIDKLVEKTATDCPTVKEVYGAKYRENPNDLVTIKTVYKKLKQNGCTSDPMYFELLEKWNTLEPTASRSRYIGGTYQKRSDYATAIRYYKQSLELEKDPTKNAKIYLRLAKIEQVANGNFAQARTYATKAAEMRAGWGDPYLFIGDLYMRSRDKCPDALSGYPVYWLAADMYAKAKDIDPDVTAKANEKYSAARKGFPEKSTVFMKLNKSSGSSYSIGCWIQRTTTVR